MKEDIRRNEWAEESEMKESVQSYPIYSTASSPFLTYLIFDRVVGMIYIASQTNERVSLLASIPRKHKNVHRLKLQIALRMLSLRRLELLIFKFPWTLFSVQSLVI